jgi:hypothetical protein
VVDQAGQPPRQVPAEAGIPASIFGRDTEAVGRTTAVKGEARVDGARLTTHRHVLDSHSSTDDLKRTGRGLSKALRSEHEPYTCPSVRPSISPSKGGLLTRARGFLNHCRSASHHAAPHPGTCQGAGVGEPEPPVKRLSLLGLRGFDSLPWHRRQRANDERRRSCF